MRVSIAFIFMSSGIYQFDLHNKTCGALVNLQWIINRNQIQNRASLALVMVIGSACLLVFFFQKTYLLPDVFIIEREVVN